MSDFQISKRDFQQLTRSMLGLAAEGLLSDGCVEAWMAAHANWRSNISDYSWYNRLELSIEPYSRPAPEPIPEMVETFPSPMTAAPLPEERTDEERRPDLPESPDEGHLR